MPAHVYSIVTDFTGLVEVTPDLLALDEIIAAEAFSGETYIGSGMFGDVVELEFDTLLTGGDLTTLTGIVNAHTGEAPLRDGGTRPQGILFARDPTVSDDSSRGVTVNTTWTNSITSGRFINRSTGLGAAVWEQIYTPATHEIADTLTHQIAETCYVQYVRAGGQVTSVIYWETSGMSKKIREIEYTRVYGRLTQVDNVQFDSAGVESSRVAKPIGRLNGQVDNRDWTKT